MNNLKLAVATVVLIVSFSQLAISQVPKADKIYKSKDARDSVLKNKGNILKLKKGDPDPLLIFGRDFESYSKLKTIDPNSVGRIEIYNSLKGLGLDAHAKGASQKLIVLVPMIVVIAEENQNTPVSSSDDIIISGDVAEPATKTDKNELHYTYNTQPHPQFPGGPEKFQEFVKANMKYPAVAIENHIQGKIPLQFVVEADGSLSNIQVIRKLGGGIDEEAVRLLKLSNKWVPGRANGQAVRTSITTVITFTLD